VLRKASLIVWIVFMVSLLLQLTQNACMQASWARFQCGAVCIRFT
jgi:hypothetical protein